MVCEGSVKLSAAMSANDSVALGVASKMISMGNKLREDATTKAEKFQAELFEISNKRSNLLNNMIDQERIYWGVNGVRTPL